MEGGDYWTDIRRFMAGFLVTVVALILAGTYGELL